MNSNVLTVVVSIAVGIAVALLTGFVDVTPAGIVGAVWYGYPFPWLHRLVIAPQYYPWRVDGLNLILDAGVWSAFAVAIGWLAVELYRRRSSASKSTKLDRSINRSEGPTSSNGLPSRRDGKGSV